MSSGVLYSWYRATLGEQVCGKELDKARPNHLFAGEKWMCVQGIPLDGATPSTSSLLGCGGLATLPVSTIYCT